jgi:hypothetical protein
MMVDNIYISKREKHAENSNILERPSTHKDNIIFALVLQSIAAFGFLPQTSEGLYRIRYFPQRNIDRNQGAHSWLVQVNNDV